MRAEDVEDGFWLGLLGPTGYLFSKHARGIKQAIERLAAAEPTRALDLADRVEAEILTSVERLVIAAEAAENVDVAGLSEAEIEAEYERAEVNLAEVSASVRPFMGHARDWAKSLPRHPQIAVALLHLSSALDAYHNASDFELRSTIEYVDEGNRHWEDFVFEARKIQTRMVPD